MLTGCGILMTSVQTPIRVCPVILLEDGKGLGCLIRKKSLVTSDIYFRLMGNIKDLDFSRLQVCLCPGP